MAAPTAPGNSAQTPRKLLSSRRNESLKLAAAACDRVSTVIIGGAILAPIFQHQAFEVSRVVSWSAVAMLLHGAAQFVLSFLEEEI